MTPETECSSDSTEDWISDVIARIRKNDLVVPENIYSSLEKLLREQISHRKLTPANLKDVADQLLNDMATDQPEPEEKHED